MLGRLQPSHRGLQLAVEPVVLDRHGGLGRQRAREVLEAGRERSHVTLDLVAAGEVLHAVALAVDELEHADHASVGRLEWHDQHRFRPVPDLAVVGPVGGERRPRRQRVDVVEIERLTAEGDVARDAAGADLDPVPLEGRRDAVVLDDGEPQHRLAGVPGLDEVERARVRVGDLTSLRHDEIEELGGIALRRQPDTDGVEILELRGQPRQVVLRALLLFPELRVRVGIGERLRDDSDRQSGSQRGVDDLASCRKRLRFSERHDLDGGVLAPDDESGLELGRGGDDHHARAGDQGVATFPQRHALIIVGERLEQTCRRGVGKRKETIDHREIGRRILANERTLEPGCRGCQATPTFAPRKRQTFRQSTRIWRPPGQKRGVTKTP